MRRKQLDIELRRHELRYGAARQVQELTGQLPPQQARVAWDRLWRNLRNGVWEMAVRRTGAVRRLVWEQVNDEA